MSEKAGRCIERLGNDECQAVRSDNHMKAPYVTYVPESLFFSALVRSYARHLNTDSN